MESMENNIVELPQAENESKFAKMIHHPMIRKVSIGTAVVVLAVVAVAVFAKSDQEINTPEVEV